MSAFADYLDLRFAVGDLAGNREISDVMPRLVLLAESWLNKKLRTRQQITRATLTLVNGAINLPADFEEMINVYGLYGRPLVLGPLSGIQHEGTQYTRYSIDGSQLLIRGVSGDRDIEYYAKLPTLTASPTTTNWLLDFAPDVYLYAVGLEAAKFLKDANLIQATSSALADAMRVVKVDDERARWANTTARMRIAP